VFFDNELFLSLGAGFKRPFKFEIEFCLLLSCGFLLFIEVLLPYLIGALTYFWFSKEVRFSNY
jgi:hypothetical protein